MKRNSLLSVVTVSVIACAMSASTAHASWTTYSMPNLPQLFGSYRMNHLSDGRVVYGTNNALYRQNSFGAGAYTQYDTGSDTWDPSFIGIASDTSAVVGQGTFGPSNLLTFNPTTIGAQTFSSIGGTMQNYSGLFYDASSLLVGGKNGTQVDYGGSLENSHSINYVTTDGLTNKVIIDDVSRYSGDFTMDSAGNLYVSDNDDLNLYMFTPGQINGAIMGAALSITDGSLVTTLNKNGSIAVDAEGRIWSAGFQSNGIDAYDPGTGLSRTFIPEGDNTNYVVGTFSDGTDDYVAFLNASGSTAGSSVTYGYDDTDNLIVPEPSTLVLFLLGGVAAFGVYRRKKSV